MRIILQIPNNVTKIQNTATIINLSKLPLDHDNVQPLILRPRATDPQHKELHRQHQHRDEQQPATQPTNIEFIG